MANPNVFQSLIQPIRSVSEYGADLDRQDIVRAELQSRRRQNSLQDAAMQQQMRKQNALERAYAQMKPGATDEERAEVLASDPYTMDVADQLRTKSIERTKAKASAQKDTSDAGGKDVETENKVISVYRDMIGMAQSPEAAAELVRVMHSDPRLAKTAIARVPLEQGLAQINADPQAFAQWKQQFGLGATKFIEQNKPTLTTQNLGGTSRIVATPGLGGPSTVATEAPITQSADNRATQATAIRGQNMTDARGREANATQRELLLQEKGLKVADLQDKADARARAKDAGAASIQNQIAVIDKALSHPGRKTATGLSGSIDPRNFVPGTDATDFRAVLDQIGGAAFLQAFESLKGGGAITEVEGKKATDAIARLNRAQSDAEFETGLRDLRKVMADGYERLGRGSAPSEAKPGAPAKTSSGATASNW